LLEVAGLDRREETVATRDRAIVAVFLFAGLRSAELAGLDLADVDWDDSTLRVRQGPGGQARRAALSRRGRELLEAWTDVRPECRVAERGEVREPLFVSRKGGRISTSALRRLVGRVEEALHARTASPGEWQVHPGALRHSHLTEVARATFRTGRTLEEVAGQAGHRRLETTRRYFRPAIEPG
jgi:integrase/recombinase XerC